SGARFRYTTSPSTATATLCRIRFTSKLIQFFVPTGGTKRRAIATSVVSAPDRASTRRKRGHSRKEEAGRGAGVPRTARKRYKYGTNEARSVRLTRMSYAS